MNVQTGWADFGRDLITTQDLDPIYTIVAAADMDDDLLARWCLAYWCYYHAGVASYVAESKRFYEALWHGVLNDPLWPRGHERRHFRREAASQAIKGLVDFGSPEKVVNYMLTPQTAHGIFKHVQEFHGFGPWISWKIADMAERVFGYDVDFAEAALSQYRDPVQGAALIYFGDKRHPISNEELLDVCDEMEDELGDLEAPPYYDRPINIQEIETVLCKWKAHCFGHYPYGNDTKHIGKGLDGWGDLADELMVHLRDYCTYAEEL